ncbi:hypothetical protein [Phytoactinopolyspora limicola]|uniref:hypothetical protein n=1 Tax=Phytoactinopolyspora limicola TaxID=2715536 RepID=UPI00140B259C|nr:hypothetical protein [Phytoactinopolyspora limicola]
MTSSRAHRGLWWHAAVNNHSIMRRAAEFVAMGNVDISASAPTFRSSDGKAVVETR